MVSLLVPTRKRPHRLKEMWDSARDTAQSPDKLELVFYVDEDDRTYDNHDFGNAHMLIGHRIPISEAWDKCWEQAEGEYLGLIGDDIIFKTPNWDMFLRTKFDEIPDKIAYVFGDDGTFNGKFFGTHGFIHQNWAKTVGYFVPPYFSANQVDRWLNEAARSLGRLRYGDFELEHRHAGYQKADWDSTYEEGRQRAPENEAEWNRRQPQLQEDIKKLQEFIECFGQS